MSKITDVKWDADDNGQFQLDLLDYVKRVGRQDLTLEEMPQGLFITDRLRGTTVLISNSEDADLVIRSLNNMKEYFGE